MTGGGPQLGGARRQPSPQELAAVAAAVELLWPHPASDDAPPAEPPPAWRFSGRWWRRPFPEVEPAVASTRAGSWAGPGGWPDPRARRRP